MQSLVSVIVPVYNTKEYLGKCFDSVLMQTYNNWELIIVDDGSTDGSAEICDQYEKADNRVRVIHKANGGNTAARRRGLEESTGIYVCFMDSDDWMEADAIECMCSYMETKDVDAVFLGCYRDYDWGGQPWNHKFEAGVYSKTKRLLHNMFYYEDSEEHGILSVFHGKLFRREKICACFDYLGDEIQLAEDRLAMFWTVLNSEKIYLGNETKYHYVSREGSIINSIDERFLIKMNHFYIATKRLFEKNEEKEVLLDQLDTYMAISVVSGMYTRLGMNEKNKIRTAEFPWHIAEKDSRIILYGAGGEGKAIHRQIKENQYWEIVAWVDKNATEYKEIGLPVEKVERLKEFSEDVKIVVAVRSKELFESIKQELCSFGIVQDKILWSREKRKREEMND